MIYVKPLWKISHDGKTLRMINLYWFWKTIYYKLLRRNRFLLLVDSPLFLGPSEDEITGMAVYSLFESLPVSGRLFFFIEKSRSVMKSTPQPSAAPLTGSKTLNIVYLSVRRGGPRSGGEVVKKMDSSLCSEWLYNIPKYCLNL